jgi:ATP-dependent Lon protease
MADDSTRDLPLLPLRDIIVFPHMAVPLFVGREKSIRALEQAEREGSEIVLSAQKRAKTEEPRPDDIFQVGTIGVVVQLLRLNDGTVKALVEGRRRARILHWDLRDPYFRVTVSEVHEVVEHHQEAELRMAALQEAFDQYNRLTRRISPERIAAIHAIGDPSRLADTIVADLALKLHDKQRILETEEPALRIERLLELLQAEIEILQVERKIRSRVKKITDRNDRGSTNPPPDQMSQVQRELAGDKDEFRNELDELEEKVRKKKVSPEAEDKLRREMKKLRMMSPMSAEATVVRNYIDWLIAMPWFDVSETHIDLAESERVLDADHYGLQKPKERILEYLAVHALVERLRGPVLCLVGPPGVGKTSLARSIATSTGRRFVRVSLGGVRDEAEIRGHRRTYIGALPGKIAQSLKKVGTNNPVMLLDEIDKLSSDFRGDPASALLEVLDPEQNATFADHYLDVDYDLSDILFITTANSLSQIPAPLRDRMEIIEIEGYTEYEKLHIAQQHLLPRQITANGLQSDQVALSEAAMRALIQGYTREAGVRSLERELASVCRKLARDYVKRRESEVGHRYRVTPATVQKLLGPPKFHGDRVEATDEIGLTHGLAWTSVGGVLLSAEVTLMPGSGKLIITGKLGSVMQESAQAAMSYVRSRALNLGLAPNFSQKLDIHVHFPEGAAPKDGPSAGITMVTAIISALTRIPVRRDVAMTGEITLRGRVLAIGGLKEKLLAAHRAGIRTVLIPEENARDLVEVPGPIRNAMEIIPVGHMDQVLRVALAAEDPEAFGERMRVPMLPPNLFTPDAVPGRASETTRDEAATEAVLSPPH